MSRLALRPRFPPRVGMRVAFDRRALAFRLQRGRPVPPEPRPLAAFTRGALALRGEGNASR